MSNRSSSDSGFVLHREGVDQSFKHDPKGIRFQITITYLVQFSVSIRYFIELHDSPSVCLPFDFECHSNLTAARHRAAATFGTKREVGEG